MRLQGILATVATMFLISPADAALQSRDINGDGISDAFYDTNLNITWLANAGLSSNSTFAQANAWANNLVVGNVSGWRLPITDVSCQAYNCTKSEMGELFYTELGSTANHIQVGSFQNVASGGYWSGTVDLVRRGQAWAFVAGNGFQSSASMSDKYSAMAVHSGDVFVAAVPEPETYAMFLAGVALISATVKRRIVKEA
jgi:hypothetical protein